MDFNVDKIIIADDHPMFRGALKLSVMSDHKDCQIIECSSLQSLKESLKRHDDADLLLLDLNMPGADGFSSLLYVQQKHRELPVMIISANDTPEVMKQAKAFGALGFIGKSANIDLIRQAIDAVLHGDYHFSPECDDVSSTLDDELYQLTKGVSELTPQQYKILMMLKRGLLNKQIAYELKISEATVKAHVTAIMRKLGANNRTQAVMKVSELNLDVYS